MSLIARLHRNWRAAREHDEEAGLALVLVIGFSFVMTSLIVVALGIGLNSVTSSRHHVNYENALSAAESGVDQGLARVQKAYNTGGASYTTPSTGDSLCNQASVSAPASFATAAAEQAWAQTQLAALAPACLQRTGTGDYVVLRPSNRQVVYSMGWEPHYGEKEAKVRMVKAEYLFAPFAPTKAILTGSNLDFSGSATVDSTSGVPAGVHTNANVTSSNASLHVSGPVTASGTYAVNSNADVGTGSAGGQPLLTVPAIDPRQFYTSQYASLASDWYDLCPNGYTRAPASTGPCTGTVLDTDGTWQGWTWTAGSGTTPPVWSIPRAGDDAYQGVYYVYQGNADVDARGSSGTWNATVIAEAAPTGGTAASCGKLGGNISFKHVNMQDFMNNVLFVAGADLQADNAGINIGTGLLAAADQLHLNTSSATIRGAAIAGDACRGVAGSYDSNSVQGVTLYYDETGEYPLTTVIRTSQWLELTGL